MKSELAPCYCGRNAYAAVQMSGGWRVQCSFENCWKGPTTGHKLAAETEWNDGRASDKRLAESAAVVEKMREALHKLSEQTEWDDQIGESFRTCCWEREGKPHKNCPAMDAFSLTLPAPGILDEIQREAVVRGLRLAAEIVFRKKKTPGREFRTDIADRILAVADNIAKHDRHKEGA